MICIEPGQFSEKPVHKDSNHRRPSVNMKAVGNSYRIQNTVYMQTAVASNYPKKTACFRNLQSICLLS